MILVPNCKTFVGHRVPEKAELKAFKAITVQQYQNTEVAMALDQNGKMWVSAPSISEVFFITDWNGDITRSWAHTLNRTPQGRRNTMLVHLPNHSSRSPGCGQATRCYRMVNLETDTVWEWIQWKVIGGRKGYDAFCRWVSVWAKALEDTYNALPPENQEP